MACFIVWQALFKIDGVVSLERIQHTNDARNLGVGVGIGIGNHRDVRDRHLCQGYHRMDLQLGWGGDVGGRVCLEAALNQSRPLCRAQLTVVRTRTE